MSPRLSRHAVRIPSWPLGTLWAVTLLMAALLLAGCGSTSRADVAATAEGPFSFWPPMPDEPRVQFLTSFQYSSDVEPPRSGLDELVFGTEEQLLAIGKPYGVEMWDGKIYVCDIANPGVVILDLRERQTRVMGAGGPHPMAQPTDIAIAKDGVKYVVDRKRGQIFVFNAEDRPAGVFGWRDFQPVGIAVRGDELFVPDFTTQSVVVMNRYNGEQLRQIGAPGGEPGQFIRPLGVDVDAHGDVFVTDVIRARLQKFTPDGELILARGEIADSAGNFTRPKHVAVDRDGITYIVDAAFQNVQMFNADGDVLMYFGSAGSHPGAMSLPAGITVHEGDLDLFRPYVHPAFQAQRLLIVTNQFGTQKVAVYALGRLKPGRSLQDIVPNLADINPGLTDQDQQSAPLRAIPTEPANPDPSPPEPDG